MEKRKSVSLVLSSGGARGLAHVGVIEELEKRGYQIAEIAGCSAGALVGGMYAAGKMDEFKDWICHLDRLDVFSLMDFTFSTRGFIKGEKVYNALKKVINDCQIEDLNVPFYCNAVDYISGNEVIFREGSLYSAIRASGSIPTVFQPARFQRHELIDGGVLNPVPLSLLQHADENMIVVVGLNANDSELVIPPKKDATGKSFISLPAWVTDYRTKMRQYFPEQVKEEKPASLSSIGLMTRSFDLLQDRFSALLIEKYEVDVSVQVARNQAGTLEFHRAEELIEIGRAKAIQALDRWENENS
ncbi:patatin-like phospholipase family protein [Algoriphagus aquimarinus]|uniref:NTE family protein n=1 Tax=Algoriphagus aquimarinus TaxID=237018 RepID=A0A1I0VU56_9BACT|nr:patatin-like phospholipase family protein [Algoriphagus aquimarinus]SFA79874.1 NTE family protein [Algoriphagus aquimarinus]|tara:strand:- start:170262 stop:171164 length:903 start_codon:yes stop_codon:yes gene_type:complete